MEFWHFKSAIILVCFLMGAPVWPQEDQMEIHRQELEKRLSEVERTGVLRLSPQDVVIYLTQNSLGAKEIRFKRDLEYLKTYEFKQRFDYNFLAESSFTRSQAKGLKSSPFDETNSLLLKSELSKRLITGTQISAGYERTSVNRESVNSSSSSDLSDLTADKMYFEVNQNLLSNAFGIADRSERASIKALIDRAEIDRLESLEDLIADGLTQYWTAFKAKKNLESSIQARDRFKNLVDTVKKKSRLGYTLPGELAQVQAEFESQIQKVKLQSAEYLDRVDEILIALQMDTDLTMEFEVDEHLPPLPSFKKTDIKHLRKYRSANKKQSQDSQSLAQVRSQTLANLDLIGRANFTGVDEEPAEAASTTQSLNHPEYYVGLSLKVPLNFSERQGKIEHHQAQLNLSEIQLKRSFDELTRLIRQQERHLKAQHIIAESATKTLELRKKALSEIEKSYRQGRSDILEVITATNHLFNSQSARIQAIGDYQVAMVNLSSTRDELLRGRQGVDASKREAGEE